MQAVLVALISAIPATIGALAMWRQAHPKPPPPRDDEPDNEGTPRQGQREGIPLLPVVITAAVTTVTVVIVALLAAWMLGRLGDDDDLKVVADTDVVVPGTQVWTDTGIDLEQGDRVTITATGIVFHAVPLGQSGPDGDPGKRLRSNVLARSDHNSLLGRIDPDGTPFHVGASAAFDARDDGRLELGINDTGVDNNAGSYRARIRVRRAD